MSYSAESKTEFERLRDEMRRGAARIISLGGLTSVASKAFVLSRLQAETQKTFVVVADSNKELETWECDLEFWSGGRRAASEKQETENSAPGARHSALLTLPSFETDVYSGVSPHAETEEKRALALWNLT